MCNTEEKLKFIIERWIDHDFDEYVEKKAENGEISVNQNYVPYGDTEVSEGEYYDEEDVDGATVDYVEDFDDDKASEFIERYLVDNEDFVNIIKDIVKKHRF